MSEVDQQEMETATARPPAASVEYALRTAVGALGPESLYVVDVLKPYLSRRCPDAEHDIGLLMIGLEEEIPQSLLGLREVESLDLLGQILQQRLCNRRSLNRYAAAWIVKAWSDALGLPRGKPAGDPAPPTLTKPIAAVPARETQPASRPVPDRSPAPTTDASTSTSASVRGPLVAEGGSSRWYQIGIAIVAMIVISFAVLFESKWSRAPSAEAPMAATPTPVAPEQASTPEVAAATAPAAEIVDVGGNEALVGDGKPHALFATLKTPRKDVSRIESRFVGGDAALWSRPAVVDLSKNPGETARFPAGTIALRTIRELKATYEFVAVTADGQRSMPFSKQIVVTPVAATPPAITNVALAAPVVSGKPFDVTLSIRDDDKQLASVERTLVGDDGQAKARIIPASTLKQTGGSVIVPITATWNASSATIELTLLGADGARSETKRVAFDVVQPSAVAAASAPAPVVGSSAQAVPATAANCTRTTCGSVVSVHELDGRTARPNYEIIVRTDDRAIHTFRQPTMLRAGSRARVVDGKLLVMNAPTTPRLARREGRLMPESEPIFSP